MKKGGSPVRGSRLSVRIKMVSVFQTAILKVFPLTMTT